VAEAFAARIGVALDNRYPARHSWRFLRVLNALRVSGLLVSNVGLAPRRCDSLLIVTRQLKELGYRAREAEHATRSMK
jgi:hypothetical protein